MSLLGNLSRRLLRRQSSRRNFGNIWKRQIYLRGRVEGFVAAPLTPFHDNGDVNYDQFQACTDYIINSHFKGLFVNGTLGEGLNMTTEERKKVGEKWMDTVSDRLSVILHIGAGNLRESQDLPFNLQAFIGDPVLFILYKAKHAESIGVSGISALPPTYHKPTSEEILVDYMSEVAGAAPNTPFYYYEYNITTGVYLNIPKFLSKSVDRIPTLSGLKHTSPELPAALNCSLVENGMFQVLIGTETQYLPTLSIGIEDVITSPYLGSLFQQIRTAFQQGDIKLAQEFQRQAQRLLNIQQKHGTGIGAAKVMFELLSGISMGPARLPVRNLTSKEKDGMRKDLVQGGFIKE